jgi:hypothetical protein
MEFNEIFNVSLEITTTTCKSIEELGCNNKVRLNNVHHYNCDFATIIQPSMPNLVATTKL